MTSKWVPVRGIAIITHTFIGDETSQLTTLIGDHISVIEQTTDWYRGQNIYTKKNGIFPKCCAMLYEGNDLGAQSLLTKKEDILYLETAITVRYALNLMQKAPPAKVVEISNRITDVIQMYNVCKLHQDDDGQILQSTHQNLASNIDNLRAELNLPKNTRSFYSSMATLSTWGRDTFVDVLNETKDSAPEYTLLHASVHIKNVKTQMIFRFFLFCTQKNSFLSCPVSLVVSPDNHDYELIFNQLEKRDLANKIWLCIYVYNMKSHREGQFDERKFVACATVEVPLCTDSESFGKSTTVEGQSNTTSNKTIHPIFHTFLTKPDGIPHSIEKTISRCAPYFTIKFTPYYGSTDDIVKGMGLQDCQIIPPLLLPSTISPKETRSMLNVNLNNLTLNINHKNTRIITRILDTTEKGGTFINGFESIMFMSHDSLIWCSPIFSGKKDSNVNETFAFDLSVTKSPLVSLFLLVQIDKISFPDKKFTPCAYGVLHLADEIGCFTSKVDDEITLYPFSPKTPNYIQTKDYIDILFPRNVKSVGKLGYHLSLASTKITQDQTLFKLLHYKEYRSDVVSNISNFMFSGISEWSKYAPELTIILCQVVSSMPNARKSAFDALKAMFAELLTRAGSEYSNIMDEFISSQFSKDNKNENYESLVKLADTMIPLINEELKGDKSSQEYRYLIRTLAYLLQLVLRSYNLKPNEENRKNINFIFNQLNDIMNETNKQPTSSMNDEEKAKLKNYNSCVLANQRLLLQHFSMLADIIKDCLPPKDASIIIYNFISSIRKDNQTIDKSKMQLLLSLSIKGIWNIESGGQLQTLLSKEINKAFKDKNCSGFINEIITAILYTSSSDFIDGFMTALEKIDDENLGSLLLSIAYVYPNVLSLPLLLKICKSEYLFTSQRLFILIYVCKLNLKKFTTSFKTLSNEQTKEFFNLVLDLSIKNRFKVSLSLDEQLNHEIYSTGSDYSVISHYFNLLNEKQKADYTFIRRILEVYLFNCNESILKWYYIIYEADSKLNKTQNNVLAETLTSGWKLSKSPMFDKLSEALLKNAPNEFKKSIEELSKVFLIIKKTIITSTIQDEKVDSFLVIYNYAQKLDSNEMKIKMLKLLYKLNISCKNELEAANALVQLLGLFKCNNEKLSKQFLNFKAKYGRELHAELLFKIVDLFMSQDHDEYALTYLNQIIDTCVKPFQNVELMIKITDLQAKIYEKIVSLSRSIPMYFRIAFYGNGFDELIKNKAFIYRYSSSMNTGNVISEMKSKYPDADVDSGEKPTKEELKKQDNKYIRISPVFVSSNEEIKDKYYQHDFKKQRYIATFEENNKPLIFRSEKTQVSNEKHVAANVNDFTWQQKFYQIDQPFPSMKRRHLIIKEFPERILNPIEISTLTTIRKNHQLLLDCYWVQDQYEVRGKIPNNDTLMRLTGIVNSQIKSLINGTSNRYCCSYLEPQYINNNPKYLKSIKELKDSIQQQYEITNKCSQFILSFENDQLKESNKNIQESLTQMKEVLKIYISIPEEQTEKQISDA